MVFHCEWKISAQHIMRLLLEVIKWLRKQESVHTKFALTKVVPTMVMAEWQILSLSLSTTHSFTCSSFFPPSFFLLVRSFLCQSSASKCWCWIWILIYFINEPKWQPHTYILIHCIHTKRKRVNESICSDTVYYILYLLLSLLTRWFGWIQLAWLTE